MNMYYLFNLIILLYGCHVDTYDISYDYNNAPSYL